MGKTENRFGKTKKNSREKWEYKKKKEKRQEKKQRTIRKGGGGKKKMLGSSVAQV